MSKATTDYLKGIATASAVALTGKRKKQREEMIDRVHRKVCNRGVSKEALTAAIESAEKTANRSKARKAA